MPTTESLRERHKADRRQRLFEAAISLFADHGFTETTVDDIAEAADVSRATFFNHFASKEAVLVELHGQLQDRILADTERLVNSELGTRQRFEEHFQRLTEIVLGESDRVRMLVRSLPSAPDLRRADQETAGRVLSLYEHFLRDGVRGGEIRADINASIAANLIAGTWTITLLEWAYGLEVNLSDRIAVKLELLFTGLIGGRGARSVR